MEEKKIAYMQCSQNGINFIKKLEGMSLKPYRDQGGVVTVGWGHTGAEININSLYSYSECDNFLKIDIQRCNSCINKFLRVTLNQNQIDALTAFIFNVGCQAFATSTLLGRLNRGEPPNMIARTELIRWVKSTIGGVKKDNKGLLKRRLSEIKLFTTPIEENEYEKI